jgi:quercetin dioxygenase-like cupin family protein
MPERTSDLLADALLGELLDAATPAAAHDVERGLAQLLSDARGGARFAPFIARLAALFQISDDDAEQLTVACMDRGAWTLLRSGVRYLDVAAGPGLAGQRTGLVSVAAGQTFPLHRHMGEETVLVLQGVLLDTADGTQTSAGAVVRRGPEHAHAVLAAGDEELVYAVVVPDVHVEGLATPAPPASA